MEKDHCSCCGTCGCGDSEATPEEKTEETPEEKTEETPKEE